MIWGLKLSYHTLINHEHRYILFWNPKVACSYIKRWHLAAIGIYRVKEDKGLPCDVFSKDFNVHNFIRRHNAMFSIKKEDLGLYSDYKKVIIIRDPMERLASFYRDKVIRATWAEHDVRAGSSNISVYNGAFGKGHKNHKKVVVDSGKLSFSDLVNMISDVPDHEIEYHLISQSRGLDGIEFDHILNISDGINLGGTLNNIFGLSISNKKFNKTTSNHSKAKPPSHSVANRNADWFRKNNSYPSSKELYNNKLKKIVMDRYKEDYLMFFKDKVI